MNKDRILALADLIEKQPHTSEYDPAGFTMDNWVHSCGTPACIAGWAAWQASGEQKTINPEVVEDSAAAFLGISYSDGRRLFTPRAEWKAITPAIAASTLRRFAETGEVEWRVS